MDEQQLAAIQEAWDVLAEWRECRLDPATVTGPENGPNHCDDCERTWAPLWRGVPQLVAEVRRLRAGLDLILWHATGQPVGMFDPHWYAAKAAALLGGGIEAD